MNATPQAKPDDTRARIMEAAEALFRRLGFAKTAVADIAGELEMSPANVYRFFPSKNAIVEAICQRCLGELEKRPGRSRARAAPRPTRLERLVLEILAYHQENQSDRPARQRHGAGRDRAQLGRHPRPQGAHAHGHRGDPARGHRGRRIRAGRPARDLPSDDDRPGALLPSACWSRNTPAGRTETSKPTPAPSSDFLLRAITPRS